jgi:hypothetical protein
MKTFTATASVVLLLCGLLQAQTSTHTVSGYVREKGSRELLTGVNIYIPNTNTGTSSNTFGFYSLTLPASDSVTLAFSFVGYESVIKKLPFTKNQNLNIELDPIGRQLKEVVIKAKNYENERISESPQMSQIEIPIAQIKKIPAFLGEKDVMKVLQLMPGVQKGSEGQSGIYVRGGGPDQNLIILDDAIVYNASHLFGFFSVFNGDALKSVELTKGGFPARFGGRLSSVIELNMKEGNKEKLHGEGGGGLIASRLTLEGPLDKAKKASFLISGRRTYLDLLAKPLIAAASDGTGSGGYYFYDLNAKINYDFGQKNKLYLSGYFGQDRFYVKSKEANSSSSAGLNWGNATATLRWNHLFNEKLFANTSLIFSNYKFQIFSDDINTYNGKTSEYKLSYTSGIRDYMLKYDLDFYPNPAHSLRFGAMAIAHRFTPSAIVVKDTDIEQYKNEIEAINNIESGLYVEDTWRPNAKFKVNGGLRLSYFNSSEGNYLRPEPRLSAAYMLKPDLSLKASYSTMNQYVHLLSNTGIGLPTDLWVPTTSKIPPQQSNQIALGLAKDFSNKGLTLTLEGYYKNMNNIINYKEGASFLLLEEGPDAAGKTRWDDNVTVGRGWSYGAEVLLQKKIGRLSGWIGYTLSWTKWQFPDLNFGKEFFPRYDRRHDISVVGIYEISPRITLSGTWVYGTGNALTVPQGSYQSYTNSLIPQQYNYSSNGQNPVQSLFGYGRSTSDYGPKNSFRAEAYHRFDLSIQFHKQKKNHERIWELSFYNLYNRRNPFFYDIVNNQTYQQGPNGTATITNDVKLKRYSIFPIVPSLSYNFKF